MTDEFKGTPITFIDPFFWSVGNNLRSASYANSNIRTWILEPQIQYSQMIGNGKLSALVGATFQQNKSDGQVLNGQGYNSDLVLGDIKSASSVTVGSTVHSIYKYNAAFARINYNWEDKYLVNLTGRRDGTSRFGPSSQFQNFGAAGLGWIFSNEKFFNNDFLTFGKLRSSYGTSGSDQVGDYSFLDLYSSNSVGVPYQGATGIFPGNLYTPDLAWEETQKLEFGMDLGFLKDRINLSINYYQNRSSNQLVSYSLPYLTGFISLRRNLSATVQNKGWEFAINSKNISSKQFRWESTLNLSINRNKLVSISPGMSSDFQKRLGNDLNSTLVYHFLGVDPTTGVNLFADGKGGGTTRPDTASLTTLNVLINPTPKYYGGFQNIIEYKNFQLDFLISFVKTLGKNYQFGNFPGNYGINQPVSVLARWTKGGDQTNIQRFSTNSSVVQPFRNGNNSDASFSDASFIRLKNISLSWALRKQILDKIRFQNLRVFIQGQNLFTITKYKGLDPETLNISSLPPLRICTVGIRATF
jgi:TonB-linked SusC/RagA family outer membrane protein